MPATLHPALERMASSDEDSLQEVADYLKGRTAPGADRVRALHDWVVDRIAYDGAAYRAYFEGSNKTLPPQDPESVFRRRVAVCAGYSKLLKKLGDLAGEQIVYLAGDADAMNGVVSHARNAAKVGDGWVLIDATWNSGYLTEDYEFVKRFGTGYLFAPPTFFVATHFPDDSRWQLLAEPLDRGEFLRAPKLTPGFFLAGLKLVSPTRSLVDTAGSVDVVVENPQARRLSATACHEGKCERCANEGKGATRLTCALPNRGKSSVRLFASVNENTRTLQQVLLLEVNNR
jgi:transglutaminase/protease-like cytokinesis protein 3